MTEYTHGQSAYGSLSTINMDFEKKYYPKGGLKKTNSDALFKLVHHRILAQLYIEACKVSWHLIDATWDDSNLQYYKANHVMASPTSALSVTVWYVGDYVTTFKRAAIEDKQLTGALMLNQQHTVRTYKTDGGLLVCTSDKGMEFITKLLCVLPKIYPELLGNMIPILKDFIQMKYFDMVSKVNAYHEEADRLRLQNKLDSWVKSLADITNTAEYQDTLRNIKAYEDALAEEAERFRSLSRQLYDYQAQRLYLDTVPTAVDETMLKLFTSSKYVTDFQPGNTGNFRMQLKCPVTDYNVSDLNTLLKAGNKNHILTSDVKPILAKEIFVDKNYTLFYEEMWSVSASTLEVDCASNRTTHPKQALRNPHLQEYHCFSSYRNQMTKALKSRDYLTLYTVLCTCTGSLNFADTGPCSDAFRFLVDNMDTPYMLQDRQGEWVTPRIIVDRYNERKQADEILKDGQEAVQ